MKRFTCSNVQLQIHMKAFMNDQVMRRSRIPKEHEGVILISAEIFTLKHPVSSSCVQENSFVVGDVAEINHTMSNILSVQHVQLLDSSKVFSRQQQPI